MDTSSPIARRTMLRGMGVAMALPYLEALAPLAKIGAAAAPATAPARAAFLFIPNGVHAPDWAAAAGGDLGGLLAPLVPLRDRLSVISGLAHRNANALGDGPGDHARSAACFLTGVHPYKTAGQNINVGVSVDQVAARQFSNATRFASLELGCEPAMTSGSCDSGYSCAYSANISWSAPDTPVIKEINPRLLFERLFAMGPRGESSEARAQRLASRRSILDFVSDDAQRLRNAVSRTDRDRLAEYLDGVREIEQRIEQTEVSEQEPSALAGFDVPKGIPGNYREHLRLMHELMILAFRLDLTRVVTFMWANEGSNRAFPGLDISEGHHHLSHHGGDESMIERIQRINRFQVEELAWLIDRMARTEDGEGGSLLDSTMLLFGGAIGDGNRHNHDNLPIVLAGGGGGLLAPSGHLHVEPGTPLCNLYLSMLDRLGAGVASFGDSTGRLAGI